VYLHFGKPSLIRERLPGIIENIARHGFKEVVFFHDECYSTFVSYAPAYGIKVPFRPVHFFEYLYNKLKEHEDEIKPLNIKVHTSATVHLGLLQRKNISLTKSSA